RRSVPPASSAHAKKARWALGAVAGAAAAGTVYGVECGLGPRVQPRAAGGWLCPVGQLERGWSGVATTAPGYPHPGRRHVRRTGGARIGAGPRAVVAAPLARAARCL